VLALREEKRGSTKTTRIFFSLANRMSRARSAPRGFLTPHFDRRLVQPVIICQVAPGRVVDQECFPADRGKQRSEFAVQGIQFRLEAAGVRPVDPFARGIRLDEPRQDVLRLPLHPARRKPDMGVGPFPA